MSTGNIKRERKLATKATQEHVQKGTVFAPDSNNTAATATATATEDQQQSAPDNKTWYFVRRGVKFNRFITSDTPPFAGYDWYAVNPLLVSREEFGLLVSGAATEQTMQSIRERNPVHGDFPPSLSSEEKEKGKGAVPKVLWTPCDRDTYELCLASKAILKNDGSVPDDNTWVIVPPAFINRSLLPATHALHVPFDEYSKAKEERRAREKAGTQGPPQLVYIGKRNKWVVQATSLAIMPGEIYLKSKYHQKFMFTSLVSQIRRVTGCHSILRNGNMIHIKCCRPSDDAIRRLALVPGIHNIFEPTDESRAEEERRRQVKKQRREQKEKEAAKEKKKQDKKNKNKKRKTDQQQQQQEEGASASVSSNEEDEDEDDDDDDDIFSGDDGDTGAVDQQQQQADSATDGQQQQQNRHHQHYVLPLGGVGEASRTALGNSQRRFGRLLAVGPGGNPVLRDQHVLCLISGGIDSPVAAFKMMCRGCTAHGVHFLNSTTETGAVMEKQRQLGKQLSLIQGNFDMTYVDISKLQSLIVAQVPNNNRTLTYKLFMLCLASLLDTSKLLVTGDSLGQVASQTITNIASIYSLCGKPIVAPLIGSRKIEIIDLGRRIGTFDLSTVQAADCCQYMMCKTLANTMIGQKALSKLIELVVNANPSLVIETFTERFRNGEFVSSTATSPASASTPASPNNGNANIIVRKSSLRLIDVVKGSPRLCVLCNVPAAASDSNDSGGAKAAWMGRRRARIEAERAATASTTTTEQQQQETKTTASVNQSSSTEAKDDYADNDNDVDGDDEKDLDSLYFDAAAGTVVARSVERAMLLAPHANPNSMHASGRVARMAVERVRAQVAAMLGKPADSIVFTAGGTEANNLALNGYKVAEREAWCHPSSADRPLLRGASGDGEGGFAYLGKVKVVELVNHETGSITPNAELRKKPKGAYDRMHVDACQAVGKIDLSKVDLSDVDTLSFTAHKFNGPCGVGVLYVRDRASLRPLAFGGSQEGKLRPGTENVPAIIGLGAALALDRSRSLHKEAEAVIVEGLKELGCTIDRRGETSGYICHATLPPGYDNTAFVSLLSARYNVDIGTGSACKTKENSVQDDSAVQGVYETLGVKPAPVKRSIRISYDHTVTLEHVQTLMEGVAEVIKQHKPKGNKKK